MRCKRAFNALSADLKSFKSTYKFYLEMYLKKYLKNLYRISAKSRILEEPKDYYRKSYTNVLKINQNNDISLKIHENINNLV